MADNPIRWQRLTTPSGLLRMVPMDHGISMGPLPGLRDPAPALEAVAPHATCVTLHKGLVRRAAPFARDVGVLLHLSASTDLAPDANDKRIVATVEEALRMGCDGVSSHLNLGSDTEADQLEAVGAISTACQQWGMPHIAMVYPRGPKIKADDPATVAHAARLGAELGADAVKVPYCDEFRDVVRGAGIPVIVAGGAKSKDEAEFLAKLRTARDAGAAGISTGRNVFQSSDPGALMEKICTIFP